MEAKTAIKTALDTAEMVAMAYLDDLTDEEMMQRPCEGCNHVNWQVGHLIASENMMVGHCFPDAMPALPEGFAERYGKEQATNDDQAAFESKETLMKLYRQQRDATLAALESATPEQLQAESDESIRSYAPTVAAAFVMQDVHWTMHAGQWAVVRRKLGRPPLF